MEGGVGKRRGDKDEREGEERKGEGKETVSVGGWAGTGRVREGELVRAG